MSNKSSSKSWLRETKGLRTQPFSSTEIEAILDEIETPAKFARAVSRERWKMAKHLKILDQALMDLVQGHQSRLIAFRDGVSSLVEIIV